MNIEKDLALIFGDLVYTTEAENKHFDYTQPFENAGKYKTRTIKSGNILEVDFYPVIPSKPSNTKKLLSQMEQQEELIRLKQARHAVNLEYTRRNIMRIINDNFKAGDLKGDLTFSDEFLPKSLKQAKNYAKNYFRRLQRQADKLGFGKIKYVYVVAGGQPKKRGQGDVRFHIHITTDFPDADIAKDTWGKSDYTHIEKLSDADGSLKRWGYYMGKNAYETNEFAISDENSKIKRYGYSLGLKKPWKKANESVSKISMRKIKQIYENRDDIPNVMAKLFKGYDYKDIKITSSKYTKGYYFRVLMVKQNKQRTNIMKLMKLW